MYPMTYEKFLLVCNEKKEINKIKLGEKQKYLGAINENYVANESISNNYELYY